MHHTLHFTVFRLPCFPSFFQLPLLIEPIQLNYKKILGSFLNQARYAIIAFTREGNEINSKEQVEALQKNIIQIAERLRIKNLPIYSPINPRVLLPDIENIQNSLTDLGNEGEASYLTENQEISFNKNFTFSTELIEDLLTKETIQSKAIMILKIKKPDYLGDSKWEFKYENRKLEAKIKNIQWLLDYQKGKIDIRLGSSLRVSMSIIVKYDQDNEVISTQYEIVEVVEIIPPTEYIEANLM